MYPSVSSWIGHWRMGKDSHHRFRQKTAPTPCKLQPLWISDLKLLWHILGWFRSEEDAAAVFWLVGTLAATWSHTIKKLTKLLNITLSTKYSYSCTTRLTSYWWEERKVCMFVVIRADRWHEHRRCISLRNQGKNTPCFNDGYLHYITKSSF